MVTELNLQRFRQALDSELQTLLHNVTEQDALLQERENSDEIDIASQYENQELQLSLDDFNSELIERVQQAIRRLDDGTFGVCTKCKKPIPEERLLAIPYAELCVACQARMEGD